MSSHTEIDAYAKGSTLYTFDPRVKLICTIIFVVAVAMFRQLEAIVAAGIFILTLMLISRVPLRHLAANYAVALIFILFASITMLFTSGPENALLIFLRISVSVMALLLLVTTTPFFKMIRAFRALHMPKLLANLIMFTYRFIFVLIDEMDRMKMARKARGYAGGRSLLDKKALGVLSATIGMIFVRSSIRATNIYDALLSRGYNGEIKTLGRLSARPRDLALAFAFVAVTSLAVMLELGVVQWTI